MNDDTRRLIYGTIIAFLLFILAWLGFIYLSACSFTLTCHQAAQLVERTSVPTLIPVKQSQAQPVQNAAAFNKCQVYATFDRRLGFRRPSGNGTISLHRFERSIL